MRTTKLSVVINKNRLSEKGTFMNQMCDFYLRVICMDKSEVGGRGLRLGMTEVFS